MVDSSKEWLRRARSSLALARKRDDELIALEDLCFQAQQATEKALKAYLVHCGSAPPRTHDLVVLVKAIEQFLQLPETIRQAVILNDYSVQTRYPGDYTPVSIEEYDEAVTVAEACLEWIENRIL
jgi:HEPN domain-containing protein